jgi:hypothetical protein
MLIVCSLFKFIYPAQGSTALPIKKVVIWGHKLHSHTHSYIHWAFHRAFTHLGYETYWLDNRDDVSGIDFSNSLFITESQVDQKIPIRDDCWYILHNCDGRKYKHLFEQNRAIILQVYTHDCLPRNVVKVDECIYIDRQDKTVYMPWATDLLPHEIDANKAYVGVPKQNTFVFIGTIGGGEFGNHDQMNAFTKAAHEQHIAFDRVTNCSMEENIARVQHAYMAPSLQGSWQVRQGYVPCRIFKNISYGSFGITNSETVYKLFHEKIVYNSDCYQLFYDAKEKIDDLNVNELYELMDFVKEKHTYINRIELLLSFLEEVYTSNRRDRV